ncbi:hypothetical protein J3R82DRAFT_9174 [Butyriboletus roseoflavus]|nr:hypothetical protein J3R82DRAFT_9174 [Butyriboletus roseoflavus]
MTSREVLLTNTHIIVASYCPEGGSIPPSILESTLIHAFTLPAAPHLASNETGILRLSHEGIIPIRLENLILVRNSIINSTTESTSLRFLRLLEQSEGCLDFFSVDLMLPRSLSDVVLPVSIEVNHVFTVEGWLYNFKSPHGYYLEASDDGHARGFCGSSADAYRPSPRITKFTVDATGDKCVATVSLTLPPQLIDIDDDALRLSTHMFSFDGVIWRFCYVRQKLGHWHDGRRFDDLVYAVIVDIV